MVRWEERKQLMWCVCDVVGRATAGFCRGLRRIRFLQLLLKNGYDYNQRKGGIVARRGQEG